ncbi:MAG: Lrp/AsnC ligand binding domain-containing protein [Thermoproteota archaeon]|nr:Lrp/AsnC ligand binding domain-containing protein [Thermoproteota archaeon]
MSQAFVLINCELGSEEHIISELKTYSDVKNVQGTFGAYDIIAEISSESVEKIRETITWKIRKIEKIRSTLTLTKVEGQGE